MTSPPPIPAAESPPSAKPQAVATKPSLLLALRGLWLFTWRPQLAWRRLPGHLLTLFALPVLVYLTIPSQARWYARFSRLIDPAQEVNELGRRLARAGVPLRSKQSEQMLKVFGEQSSRLDVALAEVPSGEAGTARQRAELRTSYDEIHSRAQDVLDADQFVQFRTFEQRELSRAQAQIRPAWGRAEPFYHWLLDLYFFVLLPLQCVRAGGGLIRDELQADTLGFLLTRPLSRATLLLLKYATQTALLEIVLLLETLLVFAAGSLRQLPGLGPLLALLLAIQVLAVPAWCGLGIFLGQVTKRYLPLALLYGLIVEMGIGRIPTNINTLSLIRHLKGLLANNTGLAELYGWTSKGVAVSVGSLLLAAALFLTLAALLFTFREYHHTAEMQK
jgi:hypothetical protein